MASSSRMTWTPEQNKSFERALNIYDTDMPGRWEKVSSMVGGGKSATDVKRHYDVLLEDINRIESGSVPFPKYRATNSSTAGNNIAGGIGNDDYRRMASLKLR